MCGIAGQFGHLSPAFIEQALQALKHRGPDGSGKWIDSQAQLAHTRLAIIDLTESGRQPICESPDDPQNARYHLVFNGEIYNFRQLRSQLEATGTVFHSQADSEVLLHLLIAEGTSCLPKLAGMFAFAFYDKHTGTALLARDGLGIKPLYYRLATDSLTFASETKVLHTGNSESALDPAALRDTLIWGSVPEPLTLDQSIRQLPAGHYLQWKAQGSQLSQWYQLPSPALQFNRSRSAAAQLTRKALLESIERHLVSDVPVGLFLSGGIDSTAILALAREVLGSTADLRTFSIGFADPAFDESDLARKTAEHFGCQHTEWKITPEEGCAEIEHFLAAADQPGMDGFNTWCVSKMARANGMKVVLSGVGGDEIFAGYPSFQKVPLFLQLHRKASLLRPPIAACLRTFLHEGRWQRLAAFLQSPGTPLAAFHAQRGIFTEAEARQIVHQLTGQDPGATNWQVPELPQDTADIISFLELQRYMRNQLLRDSDIYSMAHGLELRTPLVDTRLLETLLTLPAAIRLRPGKQLLLEAIPEIPDWIRNQPKRGFRFPFESWMQQSFGEKLALSDPYLKSDHNNWYRRWTLTTCLLWMQKHLPQ